ncbi:Condensin-2 complex subunit H2 [Camellia lanceoleosa]|uniref:Condensin-2 complex subunit H2 n=1 Tax=Camellia lanceoleosa TaxID=1840588 RepID=A0ACC0G520_9ERIC|nr:Condensin-2 complex subunit H2 [Camellia lanceoleosa]
MVVVEIALVDDDDGGEQFRQHDQPEGASVQTKENGSHAVPDKENDQFWGLDDVPVEAKNSLDSATCKDAQLNHFAKPPANLVVLEGDWLDVIGDGNELESYMVPSAGKNQNVNLDRSPPVL